MGERLQSCRDLTARWGTGGWFHTERLELNSGDPLGYTSMMWQSGWVEHLAALQEFWCAWGSCVTLWRATGYLLQKHIFNTTTGVQRAKKMFV